VVLRYRPDVRFLPMTALYFVKLAVWEPARLVERALMWWRSEPRPLPHGPIFVLGYYRSGTTHLQDLLRQDPRAGYMNFYQCFFPTAFTSTERWVKPFFEWVVRTTGFEHPAHGVPFSHALAGEDDVAMVASGSRLAANWAQVFPRSFREIYTRTGLMEGLTADEAAEWDRRLHDHLWRVSEANGHKRLVLKSPPHTGRLGTLARLYPDAKFVFIRRDPYDVYKSNLKLWKSFEKTSLQAMTPEMVRDHILWSHDQVHAAYERDKATLAPGRLCEVAFEEFVADPMGTIENIYETLGLDGFDEHAHVFQEWLDAHHEEEPAPYRFTDDEIAAIEGALGRWIAHWGYVREPVMARSTA